MKNKRIDSILQSVFDEQGRRIDGLNPEEQAENALAETIKSALIGLRDVPECRLSAAQLKSALLEQMSEVEKTEFETMQRLNDGLKSMALVPECQLSNERLRSAILGAKVRVPRLNALSYVAAAAVCAVLLLALYKNGSQERHDDVVAVNDSAAPVAVPGPDATSELLGNETRLAPSTSAKNDSSEVASTTSESRNPDTSDTATAKKSGYEAPRNEFSDILRNYDFGGDGDVQLTSVAMDTGESQAAPMVVVVDSESQTRNGAARATEKDSYGDVVFGG